MFVHPQFDPIALQLGPIAVRWYGLMYLVAFLGFFLLGRLRLARGPHAALTGMNSRDLEDLLFYGAMGVVLGGRLGYVLFYKPAYYLAHPLEIPAVWQGGMAFHGGLLGVIVAIALWSRLRGKHFWRVIDFVAPLVPIGLAAGRLGNFINGELWGRPTGADWGMVFPQAGDALARHPSQLYQFAGEGLALFVLLWWYSAKPRPAAAVSGMFLIGYGTFRFITEFFREPDAGIFGQSYAISMGQWLSLPMVLIGIAMVVIAYRRKSL